MKLYYHKTDGGAEYLCSDHIISDKTEGSFDSKYIIRIDGDIEKDAELNIREPKTKDEAIKVVASLMADWDLSGQDFINKYNEEIK